MVQIASAGWGLWGLLIFFFVVGPAMRWGIRGGRRGYWGGDWYDRPSPRGRDLSAALEERDAVIESLDARVAELENRLDFAERLLADSRRAQLGEATRTPVESLQHRSPA